MIKEEDTLKNTQTVQTIKNKEKELELKKQKMLVRLLNLSPYKIIIFLWFGLLFINFFSRKRNVPRQRRSMRKKSSENNRENSRKR